jgi:hypothetical protein
VPLAIRYFALKGQGEGPVVKFIESIAPKFRAAIISDVERVAEYGFKAPVSIKSINGHAPMFEIRTGDYRTLLVADRQELWVLNCCKKQDQRAAIEVASERMDLVLER